MSNELISLLENYFPEDDEFSKVDLDDFGGDKKSKFATDIESKSKVDSSRPRLTFKHLNKMRKIREVKKLEMAAHRQFVKTMYGKKSEDEGLGF